MANIDFSKYKAELNAIFFPREGSVLIRRSSPEYDEFWSFLEKYQTLSSRKGPELSAQSGSRDDVSPKFGLPRRYDKSNRLNLDLKSYRLEDHIRHRRDERDSRRSHLSEAGLSFFKFVLCMFVDFAQRRKFQKLGKIRSDKQNLPIFAFRDEILKVVAEHQIVLIAGDTGCGKSTQVPQYLAEANYPKVAVTQPRRIACMSLASRVGFETLSQFSGKVGYQVRFEKAASRRSAIVFLTEGLLLRQMMDDPLLERYGVLVLDEVHERHIYTDFLLGVVKCLVRVRSDVKVILMSATINLAQFSSYFDNCPVVKVPGRLFPIQLEYRPIRNLDPNSKNERLDPEPYLRIMQTIDSRYPEHERGDLLVFVSGMSDIQSITEAAKVYAERSRKWIVLALHSALSVREQDKVFDVAPFGVRKCIVSTNIAETSITIDGVRFVLDSGRVKEMSWDASSHMERLQQFWISRASAEQRKGRAGRTGPGVCFRLYAEEDYESLQEYSTPEIQRLPLDSLVLQMVSLGLPDVRKFPFLEPPDLSSLELAIHRLRELGALSSDEQLTSVGRLLSQLPVEAVLGKMLLFGALFHMTGPALSLAAALSVQSPLTARAFTDPELCRARRPFESEEGSPLTLVELFGAWLQEKSDSGAAGSRRWCRRLGLEEQRLYEMTKLRSQFRQLLEEHKLTRKSLEEEEEGRGGGGQKALDRQAYRLDRKRLQKLRREKRSLANRKKRKVLDFDQEMRDGDASPPPGQEEDMDNVLCDLEDLEFRLIHRSDTKDSEKRGLSRREIEMLKIVICSGLYPHFAIADENNSYRRDSDQSFHTKTKNFVLLHPNDFFAANPQLLRAKEEASVTANDGMSSEHFLLSFVSLLETTKPFLMNTVRVPALQALLLFAQRIEANVNGTRLVFDEWLEVRFGNAEDAEQAICSALQLRRTLDRLMKLKIKDHKSTAEEEETEGGGEGEAFGPRESALERILAFKLTDFLASDVRYGLRRLLPADLKNLYRDDVTGATKGGHMITAFLTWDCLAPETTAEADYRPGSLLRTTWTCPRCERTLSLNAAERLQHEAHCHGDEERLARQEERVEARRRFRCDLCGQDLELSSAEAIRHRRQCSQRCDVKDEPPK